MGQNLKDLFKNQPEDDTIKMSDGHESRFLEKLNSAFPESKKTNYFKTLSIAASVVVLLGLSYSAFKVFNTQEKQITPQKVVKAKDIKTMGQFSPKLKKVEDYYLASINLELSKVKLTPQNKELVDGYIARLKELDTEYENLTVELNENGPNDETLDALIDNLKFRLNLVTRLKEKIQEFDAETFEEDII